MHKKLKKDSMTKQVFRRFIANPTARIGLILIVIIVIACIIGPYLTGYGVNEMDVANINKGPSAKHLIGTDSLGRDYLTRLLYGGRYSLVLGLSGALLSCLIGIVLGCISGYYGGRVDNLIMRACDVVMAIPAMLLSIIVSIAFGTGFVNTIFALAIGGCTGGIRLIRGQVLSVRKEEYLEAAEMTNCNSLEIMFKHILPNVLSPVIVSTTMSIGSMIMVAASLSVLGLGVQPPTPEWGAMLSAGRSYIMTLPYLVIFPGIMIFLTVLGFNLAGDGLRDAIDPKLKK
ncbi:MAG: ABC transporter permease [Lachnospiraceae bacterium]|nr:ABC transporter permease [Lachnospiraceae bacterium]